MGALQQHYGQLLGLNSDWLVADVDLDVAGKRVLILLEHVGTSLACPDCGVACATYDHAPPRRWRHLDTMQFTTEIEAAVPRVRCEKCGVKTCAVPWAGKHSRFTLLFEGFALAVLQGCRGVSAAAALLGLSWDAAHEIMRRGVERGLERRDVVELKRVGIDEKSFGRGQDYVSLMTDLDGSRVLEVVPGRDEAAADKLWEALPKTQRLQVEAVAIDMSRAYENSVHKHAPQADVVHDKFHVAKLLNEAVDKVRRQEHKTLLQQDDRRLVGTKQLWLFGGDNVPEERAQEFERLKTLELKTARAWAIKENFRWFWTNCYAGNARKHFDGWYAWAVRSRLEPIVKVAKSLQRHLPNLLTYFKHHVTNALSEGYNSIVQTIKSNARGFRNFENYRTRILFFCGKLDLAPKSGVSIH
jgi:transposase